MGSNESTPLCTACGNTETLLGQCSRCGSSQLAKVFGGAIVAWPAGASACHRCGADDRPLVFRGTIRHIGALVIARNRRVAGYYCADCAVSETARSLAYTGVFGWWGLISFLFFAPRATYVNWRSVWRAPGKPLKWGAVEASAYADELGNKRKYDPWSSAAETPAGW
jgi:hypothetical protein